MIITAIKKTALIAIMTGALATGAAYTLDDVIVEWQEQAEIETALTKELASLEIQAVATAQAQQATLTSLEIAQKELELTIKTQDARRENIQQEASLTHSLKRESELAWVWTGSKGIWYGLVGIVPCAVGGLIVWKVVQRQRIETEERKLVQVMANGAIPVSREFLLNEPSKVFEWAVVRAEMEARARIADAEKVAMPSLTTYSPTTTYSPSTSTSNDKEILMMAQNRQLESEEDQNKGADGEKATIIFELLEGHGVPVYCKLLATGPQVETYSIRPGRKVVSGRMKRITVREIVKYSADIAMALGVASVRIEQKGGYIACEVARKDREFVSLEDMITSTEWAKAKRDMTLPLALGQNTLGENVILDLCTMPHILAGGATSMGKSVLIRAMITSLALQPVEKVKLTLIDPKTVEFEPFRDVPHVSRIITDMDQAAQSLDSALIEMERRAGLFKAKGVQKLSEYNEKSRDKLPYLVIVIDELADLMATNKDEVEDLIVRIAQKARFAGIHLILATQRPDADTVTPLIRANMPARVSVRTMTSGDSRTILDQTGAEKLLDQGDSLVKAAQLPLTRMQASYISMKGAYEAIGLAQKANELSKNKAVQGGDKCGTSAVQVRYNGLYQPNGYKNGNNNGTGGTGTEQVSGTDELSALSVEERRNTIAMLHNQGQSATQILKAVWGRVGGRGDKERREEIKSVVASIELNGHHN